MKKSKKSIVTLSKGPKFKIRFAILFVIMFLGSLFLGFTSLAIDYWLTSFCFLFISFLILIYILDIRGIEIDTHKNRIRNYKSYLWFKFGTWESIDNYNYIFLTRGKLVIPTSDYSEHTSDSYYYFLVKLMNAHNGNELLIAEFSKLINAQIFINKIKKYIAFDSMIDFKRIDKL